MFVGIGFFWLILLTLSYSAFVFVSQNIFGEAVLPPRPLRRGGQLPSSAIPFYATDRNTIMKKTPFFS